MDPGGTHERARRTIMARHHSLTVDQVFTVGKALVEHKREQQRYSRERFSHHLASGSPPWKAELDTDADIRDMHMTPRDMAREHAITVDSMDKDEVDAAFGAINAVRDYLAVGLSDDDARALIDPDIPFLDPRTQDALDRYRGLERVVIDRHNDALLALGADEDDLL